MPGENIYDWSTTAANNDTADALINWREGMARAAVNDSARSLMAAVAKNRDLVSGSITTGGTVNAQTFVSGYNFASIPTIPAGIRVVLKIGAGLTNTGATSLNMDNLGAIPIKSETGNDLVASMLVGGGYAEFRYDGTNWILLGFSGTLPATTINGDLTVNGNETVSGTLGVTGKVTASGGLAVTGNETVSGTLGVAGAVTAAGLTSTGDATIAGNEFIRGAVRLDNAAGGTPPSGYNGAFNITARGDGLQYGIVMRLMLDNGYDMVFTNSDDTVIGGIYNNSGSTTSFIETSDGDLKTDIEDLPAPGSIIDRLRPIKFKWRKHPEEGERSGFIAQDVYPLVPQAVVPANEGIPWMMDHSKLVPILVAELKSLRARVAELEAR